MISFEQLYDYQRKAIEFIASRKGRAYLHMPVGSGKTFVAIFLMKKYPALGKALVVVPCSLKTQWATQLCEYFPDKKVCVVKKSPDKQNIQDVCSSDFVVINYDLLVSSSKKNKNWYEILCTSGFGIVIFDEAHFIKQMKSKRTKASQKIALNIPHAILMSATPMTNSVVDLFSPLHLLDPVNFASYSKFVMRYAPPETIRIKIGTFTKAIALPGPPAHVEELKTIVANKFYRVSEKTVYQQLPEMQNIHAAIDSDDLSDYLVAEKAFMNIDVDSSEEAAREADRNLQKARQLLGMSKVHSCIRWIKDREEGTVNSKLVIFTIHRAVSELLHSLLSKESVLYYGGMSQKEKDTAISKFVNDEKIKYFIGNIQAAGTGIDGLHKVSCECVFLEFPYTHSEFTQAGGRIRRKNSTFDRYISHLLYVPNTLDERILNILDRKHIESAQILENRALTKKELLKALKY